MELKLGPTENHYRPVIKYLNSLKNNIKIIEIGAGSRILEKFIPKNITYHSLDYNSEHMKKYHNTKHDFNFNLDYGKLPIKNESYDVIICLETLEHTKYPQKVIDEIKRIGKKNATFIISIPNDYNFVMRLYYLLGKKTMVDEPFMVVEKSLHIHKVRVKDILAIMEKNFKVDKIEYIWQSRSSMNSKIALFIDKIINYFAQINPDLFARIVLVKSTNKD